ncbi:hypothetical protein ACS0TY_023261 [Phlomoides rotata]
MAIHHAYTYGNKSPLSVGAAKILLIWVLGCNSDELLLPSSAAGSALWVQMANELILNMSPPMPSRDTNPSSAELMNEISRLEVEIVHLERYLLSLYRTAFKRFLPSNLENHAQPVTGLHTCKLDQSHRNSQEYDDQVQNSPTSALAGPNDIFHRKSKEYDVQIQNSPTSDLAGPIDISALVGPNDIFQIATPKTSFGKEKKNGCLEHRSLADHLGNSCTCDALNFPDRLSEDIIRCMSSIYRKLGNPRQNHKVYSVSSTSSFCSSSTLSPRDLSDSWSPQCNDEATERCYSEGIKHENGAYAETVEVLKICLDNESYNYAAAMLQRYRSLVKSLEMVDLKIMKREQKLAFWINIHNALVMHAYLAYGTQNYIKSYSLMKASYNVGGHCISACDIQSYILGIKSHYSAPWLKTLLSPGKKFKTVTTTHAHAIEYPEPLVHFALCSGAYSDPAVRVYRAKSIFQDLNVAKEEFIQAKVYVHKQTKIYLPRILHYYAKDMSLAMSALLEVVSECLPKIQQNAIRNFVKGRPEKYVHWSEQASSFRYLIHKETAEMR